MQSAMNPGKGTLFLEARIIAMYSDAATVSMLRTHAKEAFHGIA